MNLARLCQRLDAVEAVVGRAEAAAKDAAIDRALAATLELIRKDPQCLCLHGNFAAQIIRVGCRHSGDLAICEECYERSPLVQATSTALEARFAELQKSEHDT